LLSAITRREGLAEEELRARSFGAPRALAVASARGALAVASVAGVVAGGDRAAPLLRGAVDAFGRGDARLERARRSLTSAPWFAGAPGAPKRRLSGWRGAS